VKQKEKGDANSRLKKREGATTDTNKGEKRGNQNNEVKVERPENEKRPSEGAIKAGKLKTTR